MPELIRLDEALEDIIDAVVDVLQKEVKEEGDLEGVETIVRGDRTRPAPRPPTIWVRCLDAIPNHERRSYAEMWALDVLLIAVVKSDDPEEGYRKATALAARARSVVLKDRSLGLRGFVQDVRSGRFEPSGPDLQNDTLIAASAVVQVHFTILETNP